MKRGLSEAQHRALVKKSIAHAEAVAGDDDERFVRELRGEFFAKQKKATRALHVVSARSSLVGDPSVQIYDDPRFIANARDLARQTTAGARVIGGTTVKAKGFPDCVAVGSDTQWGCTGTLIGRNAVLTAGHCAQFATRVFFGNDVGKKGKVVGVKERFRHPQYHKSRHNDLMVLILEESVTAAPRPIADPDLIDNAPHGRVVGFGSTDVNGMFGYGIKRQVDVPIASPSCSGSIHGQDDHAAYGCDLGVEIVAGKPLLERDSCNGDSGGPFYVAEGGSWLLAGATSRATDSAVSNCGDGGVYVRVDKYVNWIKSIPGIQLH
jgi:secreted trypsin-like serine protease